MNDADLLHFIPSGLQQLFDIQLLSNAVALNKIAERFYIDKEAWRMPLFIEQFVRSPVYSSCHKYILIYPPLAWFNGLRLQFK
jgi:hypothetical protein